MYFDGYATTVKLDGLNKKAMTRRAPWPDGRVRNRLTVHRRARRRLICLLYNNGQNHGARLLSVKFSAE
jgi:hypothetical protein